MDADFDPRKTGIFDHLTLEKAILDLRLSKNFGYRTDSLADSPTSHAQDAADSTPGRPAHDPSVQIVPIDLSLEAAAWQLWKSRPDKEWSLVDCSSFIVMQQRGLTEALTTDHHFEQAGFVRLLK